MTGPRNYFDHFTELSSGIGLDSDVELVRFDDWYFADQLDLRRHARFLGILTLARPLPERWDKVPELSRAHTTSVATSAHLRSGQATTGFPFNAQLSNDTPYSCSMP
jgi:hypothetical protein